MIKNQSRPLTFEELFGKLSLNTTQQTTTNVTVADPVIKPKTLKTKPDLTGKQLHSPDLKTKTSNFVNDHLWAIIVIVLAGGGAVWIYKSKRNQASRDSEAVKSANQKADEQAAKSLAQTRPASEVGEQLYRHPPTSESIDKQINREWRQNYQPPI